MSGCLWIKSYRGGKIPEAHTWANSSEVSRVELRIKRIGRGFGVKRHAHDHVQRTLAPPLSAKWNRDERQTTRTPALCGVKRVSKNTSKILKPRCPERR